MANYGAIPASTTTPPPSAADDASSSTIAFISRAKVRGQEALATRRPWKEMVYWGSFSLPDSFPDSLLRLRTNLAYFATNYAIVVLVIVFLSLLYHPTSLIVFLVTLIAWLFLYFLRDVPFVVFDRTIPDNAILAALAVLTLVLLLLTGVTTNIVSSVAIGAVLVLLHAVFKRTENHILDEEGGRGYSAEVVW